MASEFPLRSDYDQDQNRESISRAKPRDLRGFRGALGRTRTCDLLIRSQTLYPTELRARRAYSYTYDTVEGTDTQGVGRDWALYSSPKVLVQHKQWGGF